MRPTGEPGRPDDATPPDGPGPWACHHGVAVRSDAAARAAALVFLWWSVCVTYCREGRHDEARVALEQMRRLAAATATAAAFATAYAVAASEHAAWGTAAAQRAVNLLKQAQATADISTTTAATLTKADAAFRESLARAAAVRS